MQAHRKLQHDAPGAHLGYALLCHGPDWQTGYEAPTLEPLLRLGMRVKADGLTRRSYRLLLAGGCRFWRPMVRFYEKATAEAAWDYLTLVDALGWREVPDPAFMRLLLRIGSSALRDFQWDQALTGRRSSCRDAGATVMAAT
ncbi:MAG TPA: hypothetical protein PKJ45_12395 [Rubrivivax sp.]|nr:hypothetical protein [Rubrivivax sp.]